MSDYLDPNNEEFLKDFLEEARSMVDILEQNIIVLENNPDNHDSIDEIFRAAHTLKGGAATVEMKELSEFTHIIEDVLDEIRSEKLKVAENVIDVLLKAIDVTKSMVEARASGGVYGEDISDIENTLHAFLSAAPEQAPVKTAAKAEVKQTAKAEKSEELSEYELLELQEASEGEYPIYRVRVSFDKDNPMNTVGGIQVFALLNKLGKVLKTVPDFDQLYEDNFFPIVEYYIATDQPEKKLESHCGIPGVTLKAEITRMAEESEIEPEPKRGGQEIKEKAPGQEKGPGKESEEGLEKGKGKLSAAKKPTTYGSVLRVDSRRIDDLLNLVSETVIIKATFNQLSSQFGGILLDLYTAEERYRELLKLFLDTLPEYLTKLKAGDGLNNIKKDMQGRFDNLFEIFDSFEGNLKTNITQFRNTAQILGRLTGDLQEGVMTIRMVPISQLFSRFPRLVRDLTKTLKKEINLVIEGEDTELDKSVIEDILDPLVHCVRNSIDHGIETSEERKKAGKSREGEIKLSAHNEGNMIIITVSDDGCGIDVESIRKKAIERGLIHASKSMTDVEAFNLIFEPGFSTAKKITNISGRGVGLDVVRKQVEKLNGTVSVWSEFGKGSSFTIRLPLTLAIIQGLLVRIGKEIYTIPITSIIESLRIRPPEIKMIDHYEVFNFREDVLSLLRLDRLFKIETAADKTYHFVVIVGSGEKKVGLMVDSLIGEEDVVIKPLRNRYTNSPGIAGATILGDGTVALILDVSQLLELGLKREMDERKKRELSIQ